jgi:pseudouridine synthase
MKLQLFISHNGGVSRRKAFDHVLAGDVTVNGLAIREPSHMIEPTEDKVLLQGREIKPKPYEYIMLNKPAGIVTTCEAQFDQRAVISLLPPNMRHLKPVGRLDKDTEGLLLLTNDGEMANRLAHPSFDVNKTYHVRVNRRMEFREKDRLEQGVVIDKFKTAPAEVTNMNFHAGATEFDLTVHEGHKHQVRLMCHEVGHDVVHLTRIAQGPLKLDTLKVGAMRPLTGEELALLHAIARPETGRSPRISPKPAFKSNSTERRYSANRDWHSDKSTRRILSGSTGAPRRDDAPRTEGAPRREYKSYSSERPRTDGAPRREYKPYSRDARPSSDRPRTEGYVRRDDRPRTEGAPRREYKPYSRDARPSSDRPRTGSYVRRDDKPRTEGAPRREYKPYSRDARPSSDRPRTEGYVRRDDRPRTEAAPRREYKPYSREARPSSDRPRTGSYVRRDDAPRTEGAPRREYKPYSRDARPSSDRPRSGRPSSGKTFTSSTKPYKKPFGKKTFRKSV